MELFLYYSYCDGVAHLFLRGCGGATFTRNPWPSLAKQSQDYGLMVIYNCPCMLGAKASDIRSPTEPMGIILM